MNRRQLLAVGVAAVVGGCSSRNATPAQLPVSVHFINTSSTQVTVRGELRQGDEERFEQTVRLDGVSDGGLDSEQFEEKVADRPLLARGQRMRTDEKTEFEFEQPPDGLVFFVEQGGTLTLFRQS
ncbi:MAG: hypothetical protein U5K28_01180 [Halobacteriales archaeon]|nr:hypothetical protein [Halobacteriales archaeon]